MYITGSAFEIDRFLAKCFTADDNEPGHKYFDFEKINPVPKVIRALEAVTFGDSIGAKRLLSAAGIDVSGIVNGSRADTKHIRRMTRADVQRRFDLLEEALNPAHVETAHLILECHRAVGCLTSYGWRVRSWGTKWNTLYTRTTRECETELEVTFDTAWTAPLPIFRKLGRMFPDLRFSIAAADPDMDWALKGMVRGSYAAFQDAEVEDVHERIYGEPMSDPDEDEDGDEYDDDEEEV
jgi:hypothetical protein